MYTTMYLKFSVKKSTRIVISDNFIKYLLSYISKTKPSKVVYVTDKSLYPLLQKNVPSEGKNVFVLNNGECEKNLENFEKILNFFFRSNIDKTSLIVAFGGGMVSDVVGFAASVYYRGVPLIIIPTSLLAQVDAAIGGKNTINFHQTKNVLGTIYMPSYIIIDTNLIKTLPQKELSSGMAEIIKYAVGFDKRLLGILNKHPDIQKVLPQLIKRSVEIKTHLVVQDLYEEGNKRKLLNLGHTLGQALESQRGYALSHGQAVSIGLLFSLYISFVQGNITKEEFARVLQILRKHGLPPKLQFSISETMQKMRYDKKSHGDGIDFILLKSLGKSYICKIHLDEIQLYLKKFQSFYYSL